MVYASRTALYGVSQQSLYAYLQEKHASHHLSIKQGHSGEHVPKIGWAA